MPLHRPKKRELVEENRLLKSALVALMSGASVRIYLTNADRQRAYRQRKAAESAGAVGCS